MKARSANVHVSMILLHTDSYKGETAAFVLFELQKILTINKSPTP